MEIKHSAVAGTLESSDAQVSIEPADTLSVQVTSSVEARYGRQIRATVEEVLSKLKVTGANVVVRDRGALDCTLRARLETAIFRSVDQTTDLPWGEKL